MQTFADLPEVIRDYLLDDSRINTTIKANLLATPDVNPIFYTPQVDVHSGNPYDRSCGQYVRVIVNYFPSINLPGGYVVTRGLADYSVTKTESNRICLVPSTLPEYQTQVDLAKTYLTKCPIIAVVTGIYTAADGVLTFHRDGASTYLDDIPLNQ